MPVPPVIGVVENIDILISPSIESLNSVIHPCVSSPSEIPVRFTRLLSYFIFKSRDCTPAAESVISRGIIIFSPRSAEISWTWMMGSGPPITIGSIKLGRSLILSSSFPTAFLSKIDASILVIWPLPETSANKTGFIFWRLSKPESKPTATLAILLASSALYPALFVTSPGYTILTRLGLVSNSFSVSLILPFMFIRLLVP